MKRLRSTLLSALAGTSVLWASACAVGPPAPAPHTYSERQAAIVNGSLESGWEGVGALTYSMPGYGYQGEFCTAALIAPQWVLTAGHCVNENDGFTPSPQTTYFYVGTDANPAGYSGPASGQLYAVDSFVPHPQYDATNVLNDIALVHLSQPVTGVPTYAINTAYPGSGVNNDAFFVGFGVTDGVNQQGSGIKRSTSLPIAWIYDTTIMTQYSDGQTGTCFGDSGGPSFVQFADGWRIVGVNSTVAGTCDPNYDPGCDVCKGQYQATRVDAYASWINQVIGAPPPSCLNNPGMCSCDGACQADGSCDNTICQTLSCEDIYTCMGNCVNTDTACQTNCYNQGTNEGKAQLDAMEQCFAQSCPDATDESAWQQCVSTNCGDQVSTCLPVGTGPASCKETYNCMVGCPQDDNQCRSDCYQNATADAQIDLNTMLDCFNNKCGDATDFATCANTNCATEIDVCMPPTYGSATCEEVYGCFGDCADNDSQCVSDCYDTGTPAAHDQVDAIGDCIQAHCADLTGDARTQCAYDNCGAEIDTCFPPANCAMKGGDCPAGQGCYPTASGATDCFPSQGLTEGATCADSQTQLACADGMVCVGPDGGATTCQRACTADPHCKAGEMCSDPVLQGTDVGVCEAASCTDADGDGVCADQGDCDDNDAAMKPGLNEVCGDGKDNNCDGQTDEECGGPACTDGDGDGVCADAGDCDDSDAATHPGAVEACGDQKDNDCDGQTDEDCAGCLDQDGDGYCATVDCDDSDAQVNPAAEEVCDDGVDNDCDGQKDEGCSAQPACTDADGDGVCVEDGDCDDTDAATYPGAVEACGDQKDQSCDGAVDEGCEGCVDQDGDGYCATVDCNDFNAAMHPGAAEICGNGVDDNCSGAVDEGCGSGTPFTPSGGGASAGSAGGGCSGSGSNTPAPLGAALGLLMMLAITRRRRA